MVKPQKRRRIFGTYAGFLGNVPIFKERAIPNQNGNFVKQPTRCDNLPDTFQELVDVTLQAPGFWDDVKAGGYGSSCADYLIANRADPDLVVRYYEPDGSIYDFLASTPNAPPVRR